MNIKDDIQLKPGNYAVIFITERRDNMIDYNDMDIRTMHEAQTMEGFIGYESLRIPPMGIFISYWKDRASIDRWKEHTLHLEAKAMGKSNWYDAYRSIVCPVEHVQFFRRQRPS